MTEVWKALGECPLPKLLYGMGNGGDKMLEACQKKGIGISGVFASDGFARGNLFHGMQVTDYKTAKERFGRFAVLLSFATSRPEVLENIRRISEEQPLFAPDLPVAGDTLFDAGFYEAHKEDFSKARSLFDDPLSQEVFDRVIEAKFTGRTEPLFGGCTTAKDDFTSLLCPGRYEICGDFGAYNGDTARELLDLCPQITKIVAVEADPKTFLKLRERAADARIVPVEGALWSEDGTLSFSASGGRGAALNGAGQKSRPVRALRGDGLFENLRADYLKFDVEGAEAHALAGLERTIARDAPDLLVSVYHRPEDLYALPLDLHSRYPFYRFALRRRLGVPAWDINLYCLSNRFDGWRSF